MLIEEDELHRLRGKTGSGIAGDQYIGWFVGYEERNGDVYFFALNIRAQARRPVAAKPGRSLCRSCRIHSISLLNESMTTQTPDPREELSIRTVKTTPLAGEFSGIGILQAYSGLHTTGRTSYDNPCRPQLSAGHAIPPGRGTHPALRPHADAGCVRLSSCLPRGLPICCSCCWMSPNAAVVIRNWWPVYGTLVDVGCLGLLFWLTRQEGLRLLDLTGFDIRRVKTDIPLGIGLSC